VSQHSRTFHVLPYGETPGGVELDSYQARPANRGGQLSTDFDKGVLLGLLIGEGHFGGDGRQPHVTLRMHVKHAALFNWIQETFPGGKLYGPYDHGGRQYLQWMARGAYLREVLVPLLDEHLSPRLDAKSAERYAEMKSHYHHRLQTVPGASSAHLAPPVTEDEHDFASSPLQREDVNNRSRAAEIFDRIRREQAD
jgi:hypothetical protein